MINVCRNERRLIWDIQSKICHARSYELNLPTRAVVNHKVANIILPICSDERKDSISTVININRIGQVGTTAAIGGESLVAQSSLVTWNIRMNIMNEYTVINSIPSANGVARFEIQVCGEEDFYFVGRGRVNDVINVCARPVDYMHDFLAIELEFVWSLWGFVEPIRGDEYSSESCGYEEYDGDDRDDSLAAHKYILVYSKCSPNIVSIVLRSNRSISFLQFQVLSREVSFSVPLLTSFPSLQSLREYIVSSIFYLPTSIDIHRHIYKFIYIHPLTSIGAMRWLPKHNLWLRRER